MGVWERRYYRVLNAVMRVLLRSPLHRLRSRTVILLEFRGRRSGRRYRMPVSYWQPGPGEVVCLSSATWARWWANLDGAEVVIWLRGAKTTGSSALVTDPATRRELVTGFLLQTGDAHHYGVETGPDGQPLEQGVTDLAGAAETKVIRVAIGR